MQHCEQMDRQNGIFPKECLPQKRNLNERRRRRNMRRSRTKRTERTLCSGLGCFSELMGILRPTIQRIITEVIQEACVLPTFYMNYHSKFESLRIKTTEAISHQNSGSL